MFLRRVKPAAATGASPMPIEPQAQHLMSAHGLSGREVFNRRGEDLGDVRDLMIDMATGRVVYAVLSFGGFLSLGDKRFAVPWAALSLDPAHQRFVLNVERDSLLHAPAFDSDHWPDMDDPVWARSIAAHYGIPARGSLRA